MTCPCAATLTTGPRRGQRCNRTQAQGSLFEVVNG